MRWLRYQWCTPLHLGRIFHCAIWCSNFFLKQFLSGKIGKVHQMHTKFSFYLFEYAITWAKSLYSYLGSYYKASTYNVTGLVFENSTYNRKSSTVIKKTVWSTFFRTVSTYNRKSKGKNLLYSNEIIEIWELE